MSAVLAFGLGLLIGAMIGGGVMSFAAIIRRAALHEECDAIAYLQFQRGYRKGLEERK